MVIEAPSSCSRRDEDKNAQMREDALLVVLLRILAFAHLHVALNCNSSK